MVQNRQAALSCCSHRLNVWPPGSKPCLHRAHFVFMCICMTSCASMVAKLGVAWREVVHYTALSAAPSADDSMFNGHRR